MELIYHASSVEGIITLEPRTSNHGVPRVYFSKKRENVLVYLSNAVEKYCRDTGFDHNGVWQKWGPYGFNKNGILRIEEYYPNALESTYKGVSAYIYTAETSDDIQELSGIRDAVYSEKHIPVAGCEFIPDAYEAIMAAYREGLIDILMYDDMTPPMAEWSHKTMLDEYKKSEGHPDYRHFLLGNFPFLRDELESE